LIRKAIEKEFPQVPVLSLNVSGLEKEKSLPLSLSLALEMMLVFFYGDMMMLLFNQTVPYETYKGQAREIMDRVHQKITDQLNKKEKGFYHMKRNYAYMVKEFSAIKIPEKRKPRVGIVGEIYVKYSTLANNGLTDFLVSEGCEAVQPSLIEFLLYCLVNNDNDFHLYGKNKFSYLPAKLAYKWLYKRTKDQAKALKGSQFIPYDDFEEIKKNGNKIISEGVKMGEGWGIPSEMVTMAQHGIKDIVCAQPFGCLPNHIVGKGMIRPVKAMCPELNIAAIDYDPGATKVNQENRIKLMLSNIAQREDKK
jgi:predicted nucleotide-binding protein (sugar kinase/HSP70/actin superfamily)